MTMIRKTFSAIETKVLDEAEGLVEATVNVTGVADLQRDIMVPGCFGKVIKSAQDGTSSYPTICWNHDWATTVGKVTAMEELMPGDPRLGTDIVKAGGGGLRIVAKYNLATSRGRDAFSDVAAKLVEQWSVGFMAGEGIRYDDKGFRHVAVVDQLPEVSNVLMGASQGNGAVTATTAVKALDPADRAARTADLLQKARGIATHYKAEHPFVAKVGGAIPGDPPGVPFLTEDEAVHNGPLVDALTNLNTLIGQELAEGYTEYNDIIRLCCIACDLLGWARGEQSEYGDASMPMMAYLAAGIEALTKQEPPPEPPKSRTPAELLIATWANRPVLEPAAEALREEPLLGHLQRPYQFPPS